MTTYLKNSILINKIYKNYIIARNIILCIVTLVKYS